MVTVFDNLSMNIDYHSYSIGGATGYKLNMTTWLSTRLPRSLAPAMDAKAICGLTQGQTHSYCCIYCPKCGLLLAVQRA